MNRLAGSTNQPGIKAAELLRQRVINADGKHAAVQCLSQVDIQLVIQPLLIAEAHIAILAKTQHQPRNSKAQAAILLVIIANRVGDTKH